MKRSPLSFSGLILFALTLPLTLTSTATSQAAEKVTLDGLLDMVLELKAKQSHTEKELKKARLEAAKTKVRLEKALSQLAELKGQQAANKGADKVADKADKAADKAAADQATKEAFTQGPYFDWTIYKLAPTDNGMDYAIKDQNNDPNRVEGFETSVGANRSPGVKFKYGFEHSDGFGWEVSFLNSDGGGNSALEVDPGGSIWGTRLHANAVIDDNDVDTATAARAFSFNVFDAIGFQRLNAKGAGKIRWFGGFRMAKLKQDLDITYIQDTGATSDRVANINEYNKIRGVGPRLGFAADLPLGRKGLFFNFEGAASLVHSRNSYKLYAEDGTVFTDGTPTTMEYRTDIQDDNRKVNIPVYDFTVGLSFVKKQKNNADLKLTVGYHYENWRDAHGQMRFLDDVDSQLATRVYNDLSFSGSFFKLSLGF